MKDYAKKLFELLQELKSDNKQQSKKKADALEQLITSFTNLHKQKKIDNQYIANLEGYKTHLTDVENALKAGNLQYFNKAEENDDLSISIRDVFNDIERILLFVQRDLGDQYANFMLRSDENLSSYEPKTKFGQEFKTAALAIYDGIKTQIDSKDKMIAELQEENTKFKEENTKLKEENARLKDPKLTHTLNQIKRSFKLPTISQIKNLNTHTEWQGNEKKNENGKGIPSISRPYSN